MTMCMTLKVTIVKASGTRDTIEVPVCPSIDTVASLKKKIAELTGLDMQKMTVETTTVSI